MTGKKITALALAAVLAASVFGGCEKAKSGKESIAIPAVTVDLQAPENRVQVSQENTSWVTDASGQRLTDSQWLLNSKFSKAYIQSLGEGTYSFTYESDTQKGTITMTVTDSQPPAYLFAGTVPETVTYLTSVTLPELVRNQDSYQADCQITYALKRGEEAVETEGFVTPALTEGSYTWTASAVKDGTPYEFTQSFYVQSFEEYLDAMKQQMLWDKQKNTYISPAEGVFPVNTLGNTLDYFYTVNPEVLATAMTAGKETVSITVVTDEPLVQNKSGSLWISNNWNGYVFSVEGDVPFVTDRSGPSWPNRFTNSVVIENGKYIYTGTAFLDPMIFTEAQPLTLQFNYAQCEATVSVSFA